MIYKWPFAHELLQDANANYVFPPNFFQNQITQVNGLFVEFPDVFRFNRCSRKHGFPFGQVSRDQLKRYLVQMEGCADCSSSVVDMFYRPNLANVNPVVDILNINCLFLSQQLDKMEHLLQHCPHTNERELRLFRLEDSRRGGPVRIGEWIQGFLQFPGGVRQKIFKFIVPHFNRILRYVIGNNIGFVKGKFLVISLEFLVRHCNGNKDMCLGVIGEAYVVVQMYYCGLERLILEGGFWKVSPEMGGFFWKNTHLETHYPFLRRFIRRAIEYEGIILVRNFSLSMGPHYIVGGGRFGYVINHQNEVVFWFIPNIWSHSLFTFSEARQDIDSTFWYGWYDNHDVKYSSSYYGLSNRECDVDMLKMISKATEIYYES